MDAALLPVKRLDAAKSRLEGFLDAGQRLELAQAMLEDALDLCTEASFFEWFVLSPDEEVLRRALDRGFRAQQDPVEDDLNASLRHGIKALSHDAESVTIVPVDAPLATADELRDLLDTGSISDIVVVPAERDAGTNGLYLAPPDALEPRFGENSFSAYVRDAAVGGLRCSILPLAGLSIDIDTVEDVERIVAGPESPSRAVRLLRGWTGGAA